MRTFAHLVFRHLNAGVEVGIEKCFTELLRAIRVGALADNHERGVLFKRNK